MKQGIWIRTEGGADIGWGHVVRCLALAHMLKQVFDIQFALVDSDTEICNAIKLEHFRYRVFDSEAEFLSAVEQNDIVVIDHYGLNEEYHKTLKSNCSAVVCIDDLQKGEINTDIVINSSPGASKDGYQGALSTRFLLGPDYALLRPEFLDIAKASHSKNSDHEMFICFGGSDPKNITSKAIHIALEFPYIKRLNVVTGKSYKHLEELSSLIESFPGRIEHYHGASSEQVRNVMLKSQYAIVPSSGIVFEALACRLDIVSGYYVENQHALHHAFLSKGAFLSAKDFQENCLRSALVELEFKNDSDVNEHLIDGLSGERILKEFTVLKLQHRLACSEDSRLIYDLVNDPYTRSQSYSPSSISFEDHDKWFQQKIDTGLDQWLVFSNVSNDAVGFVRLTKQGDHWVVGVTIQENFRGLSIAPKILRIASDYALREAGKSIHAYIKETNTASIKSFTRAGYKFKKSLVIKESPSCCYIYEN